MYAQVGVISTLRSARSAKRAACSAAPPPPCHESRGTRRVPADTTLAPVSRATHQRLRERHPLPGHPPQGQRHHPVAIAVTPSFRRPGHSSPWSASPAPRQLLPYCAAEAPEARSSGARSMFSPGALQPPRFPARRQGGLLWGPPTSRTRRRRYAPITVWRI